MPNSIKISETLGDKPESVLNTIARSKDNIAIWVSIKNSLLKNSFGFVKVNMESGCWCLDFTPRTNKYVFGFNNKDIEARMQHISDYIVTQKYTLARGTLCNYLKEVQKLLREDFGSADIELKDIY